jgi:anti-sigma factor RsiW
MKHETELRIQAWIDGQLEPVEAGVVAELVASDPAARALADELRMIHGAFAGNETPRPVPDIRAYYWAQIAEKIKAEEPQVVRQARPVRLGDLVSRWLGSWAPLAAAAGVVAMTAILLQMPDGRRSFGGVAYVESPQEEVSTFTFRSETEGMTVVWLNTWQDRDIDW